MRTTSGEPRAERLRLHVEGGVVRDDTGRVYDVAEAIETIPWVTAKLYPPAHQYAILNRCPTEPWDILTCAIREMPDSYMAYFRGYVRPMRYWEFEGRRYWRTASGNKGGGVTHMVNRALFEDAEPPRRVDEGAKPIPWDGPPWDVYGSKWPSWFVRDPTSWTGYRDGSTMAGGVLPITSDDEDGDGT